MKKLVIALSVVTLFIFSACDGIEIGGGVQNLLSWYEAESGTIVYGFANADTIGQTLTLAFDNNGKRERIEFSNWEGFEGNVVFISNQIDSTYVTLAHYYDAANDTTYNLYYKMENQVIESAKLLYVGNTVSITVDTTMYPVSYKEIDTIAGKPCSVLNLMDADSNLYRYGGWKRIIFICEVDQYLDYPIVAQSYETAVDDDAFIIPEGYVDATTLPEWAEIESHFPQF